MRLSEAMRLGAMLKPQAFLGESIQGASVCALGAAADAIGLPVEDDANDRYRAIDTRWPELLERVDHPAGWGVVCLRSAIWYLNDYEKWSRERIADWVKTVEQRSGDTRALVAVGLSDDATQLVNAR